MTPVEVRGLISFWDFQEEPGQARVARLGDPYRLQEVGGPVERADGGIFGPYAAKFTRESAGSLVIPRAQCPSLNLHGPNARVTLIAWIKRAPTPPREAGLCQAVAGMWNEHAKRQYCLFLNLRIHESAEQVGAHISSVGGATPGFKYCMDAAIGATPVPPDTWQCVAITYDGAFARAYLNGRLDRRGDRNPYRYEGGIFDGGPTARISRSARFCAPSTSMKSSSRTAASSPIGSTEFSAVSPSTAAPSPTAR
jgi:hypothetical protein